MGWRWLIDGRGRQVKVDWKWLTISRIAGTLLAALTFTFLSPSLAAIVLIPVAMILIAIDVYLRKAEG